MTGSGTRVSVGLGRVTPDKVIFLTQRSGIISIMKISQKQRNKVVSTSERKRGLGVAKKDGVACF